MNTILEVAIGLAFVYLLFSLLASTVNEAILGHLAQLRSRVLRESLCALLSDQTPNTGLVEFWHVIRLVLYRLLLFFHYPKTDSKTASGKTDPKVAEVGTTVSSSTATAPASPNPAGSGLPGSSQTGSGEDNFAQMILQHPLVKGLAIHGQPCPNYLPAENFADAVIGTLIETAKMAIENKKVIADDIRMLASVKDPADPTVNPAVNPKMSDEECLALAKMNLENIGRLGVNSIAIGLKHLPDAYAQRLLTSVLAEAKKIEVARQNLITWFNNSMDRVTGLYRRKTQFWLYIWATLIVLVFNVDSIEITKKLYTDSEFRDTLVARATSIDTNSLSHYSVDQLQSQIQDLKLPIGWPGKDAISKITNARIRAVFTYLPVLRWDSGPTNQTNLFFSATLSGTAPYPQTREGWWLKLLGLLVTVAAVSQGAPFWFDMLNRFTNLRAAGKPPKIKEDPDPKNSA